MSTNPPRLKITQGPLPQSNHPNTTTTATTPTYRSTIDDCHEIIREQPIFTSNHSPDVTVKKYSLLPGISPSPVNGSPSRTEPFHPKAKAKKQVYNHFARPQPKKLPPTGTNSNTSVANAMDLDEDLPQYYTESNHRAATYTSPGERIISPIERPSAPAPPTSAQIQRANANILLNNNEDDDDDDELHDDARSSRLDYDDSQIFNENFYHYPQPIMVNNRRIDHYNPHHHHGQIVRQHPTIVLNDGYDDLNHSLDYNDYEP